MSGPEGVQVCLAPKLLLPQGVSPEAIVVSRTRCRGLLDGGQALAAEAGMRIELLPLRLTFVPGSIPQLDPAAWWQLLTSAFWWYRHRCATLPGTLTGFFAEDTVKGTAYVAYTPRAASGFFVCNLGAPRLLLPHEIGHCCGLRHTTNRASIMYPTTPSGAQQGFSATELHAMAQSPWAGAVPG